MGFLKNLFGGGGANTPSDSGVYVYVKVHRTKEIVQVRLQRGYDISQSDDGGYFANKVVMGNKSFDRIDATFYFDSKYRLTGADLSGGEIATEDDFEAQEAKQDPE